MITGNYTAALIVAQPGSLQVGLQALLIAMPQIDVVHQVDDLSAALQTEVEPQPVLVLLDGDMVGEKTWLTLRQMRLKWPRARFVFLANDVQQERRASHARADAVLLKGSPPARLVAILVRLLGKPQRERDGGPVAVSIQPRRGRLPCFSEQLDATRRGRRKWSNQRNRAGSLIKR